MKYSTYIYLPPPYPTKAIMPDSLGSPEYKGWWAQVKKNGTNCPVYCPPRGADPFARTRHGPKDRHKAWQFTEKSIRAFREVQNDEWNVFCTELMHSKGYGLRDTLYVYDILVYNGKWLLGTTFQYRQAILKAVFGRVMGARLTDSHSHWEVDDNVWLAQNHQKKFRDLFFSLTKLDEGIVLKDPNGVLSARDNGGWQVKCRRETENYGF